jgi:hypothetical protein
VQDSQGMVKIAAGFYMGLFKWESRKPFCLGSNFWEVADLVLPKENAELEAPFNENEVRNVVFSSYAEGAPGPDGLSFLFYQKFWGVIKTDLKRMFHELYEGRLDLFKLNFVVLSLIPKLENATDMKMFRHISLLNYSFKIFSKVLTLRLEKVC